MGKGIQSVDNPDSGESLSQPINNTSSMPINNDSVYTQEISQPTQIIQPASNAVSGYPSLNEPISQSFQPQKSVVMNPVSAKKGKKQSIWLALILLLIIGICTVGWLLLKSNKGVGNSSFSSSKNKDTQNQQSKSIQLTLDPSTQVDFAAQSAADRTNFIKTVADIKLIHGELENYYARYGYYPAEIKVSYFPGMDADAIIPASGIIYKYFELPIGCTTSQKSCQKYTLDAIDSNGKVIFQYKSLN